MFAQKMMHQDSKWIPEILKAMISDDQAKLLVSLPGTAEQMAEKTGRPADEVGADLKEMFIKGLTFKKEKGGQTLWRAPMHLAQFHDATILWPEAPESFYDLWKKYMEEEWPDLAKVITKLMPRPFTRVVPVEKSVETGKAQVLAPENITEIINNADRIAVTNCTCRLTMKKCDTPVEVCMQINRGADYTVERGSGREISKEEALKMAREVEEAGLVHVTMNKAGIGHFICNCCGCCCQSFTMLISDGLPLCDPSRYRPEVNADNCSACGDCEERCWFGAVIVGDDDVAVVDGDLCLGCGQCAIACPEEAIAMNEVREPGFIPE
jgi:Pyruvate/2-oxoacid:ferredoxin oxidoreductase delta subunit